MLYLFTDLNFDCSSRLVSPEGTEVAVDMETANIQHNPHKRNLFMINSVFYMKAIFNSFINFPVLHFYKMENVRPTFGVNENSGFPSVVLYVLF